MLETFPQAVLETPSFTGKSFGWGSQVPCSSSRHTLLRHPSFFEETPFVVRDLAFVTRIPMSQTWCSRHPSFETPFILRDRGSRHPALFERPCVRDPGPQVRELWCSRHPSSFETRPTSPCSGPGVRDTLRCSRPGVRGPHPHVRDLLFETHPCSRHPSWRKNLCPTHHALFEARRSTPSTPCVLFET